MVEIVKIRPQKASPITPPVIEFHVITKETQQEKLVLHDSYMSLSWNDYLTLGQYFKDINRYLKVSNKVIEFYEEDSDTTKVTGDK